MIPVKKAMLALLIVLVIIVLFEVIRTLSNPLTPSDDQLRSRFLEQTPLGTSMEDVIQSIDSKKDWRIKYIDNDNGFTHQRKRPAEKIGVRHIRVHIGEYRVYSNLYFATDVVVFYGFNENNELVDIWVRKDTDVL
ncbi:hypothetical protein [Paenibacillus sp. NPDC057967]|uniref:hypothetical protein n=1 Tax=Paenibacillus sp. NPDC057967 TaxID=3346293 RepID=UPI0036D96323